MDRTLPLEHRITIIEHFFANDQTFDSIQVSRLFSKPGTPNFDRHDYADYLEELTCKGILKYAGIGRDGRQNFKAASKPDTLTANY